MSSKVEPKSSLPKIVNSPVDLTTHTMLTRIQQEGNFPTLAAVLQAIVMYYWTKGPIGHSSFPTNP
jgi:hypothetical protein